MLGWEAYSKQEGKGIILSGLDHSEKSVATAQARFPDLEIHRALASDLPFWPICQWDIIYTHTCLQHNSAHKLAKIFDRVHKSLSDRGIFYLLNELTRDSEAYAGYHKDFVMEPWSCDERGSAGTAAWWIGFICDHNFELMEYFKSSYVFRRI